MTRKIGILYINNIDREPDAAEMEAAGKLLGAPVKLADVVSDSEPSYNYEAPSEYGIWYVEAQPGYEFDREIGPETLRDEAADIYVEVGAHPDDNEGDGD